MALGILFFFNEITQNSRSGTTIEGILATGNMVIGNSIHQNGEKGIYLYDGGNTMLAKPVILSADASGAAGTGCIGCTVHLYSDSYDEGEIFEGSASVDGSGKWSYSGGLTGPYVTATNTDGDGNTSEFSAPRKNRIIYLPIVKKN